MSLVSDPGHLKSIYTSRKEKEKGNSRKRKKKKSGGDGLSKNERFEVCFFQSSQKI
jgi:hypothetical protein